MWGSGYTCKVILGVTIDDELNWKEHTGVVCNRLAKHVGVFYKLKFVPKERLMILYNTLILPHLNYCILVWACSSMQNTNRLLILQKKIIRIISHSQYLAHTIPLFYNREEIFAILIATAHQFLWLAYHGLSLQLVLIWLTVKKYMSIPEEATLHNCTIYLLKSGNPMSCYLFLPPTISILTSTDTTTITITIINEHRQDSSEFTIKYNTNTNSILQFEKQMLYYAILDW